MTDWRTPAQRAADEQLSRAVEAAVSAYGHLPGGAILQDFIVQGRGVRYDDNGERVTHIFTALQDGSLDPVTILGHASMAFFRWGSAFADTDEDRG